MTFYVGVDPEFSDVDSLQSANVILYEGQSLVTGAELTPDLIKQSCFIPTQNFDFRTLKVEVDVLGNETYVEYRLGSANEANIYADSKVYFLDGNGQGFDVKFVSGQIDPSTGQSVGNALTDSSRVKVSYIIPSGSVANGINNFGSFGDGLFAVTVPAGESSSGGRTTLSAADLKFFIPRTFSAQNRIVTMSDIKSALMSNFPYTQEEIFVASGADLTTPVSGTVYIYVTGVSNDTTPGSEAQNIIDYIKSIGMLGISYVYDTNLGVPTS